jgi:hypothetical protein
MKKKIMFKFTFLNLTFLKSIPKPGKSLFWRNSDIGNHFTEMLFSTKKKENGTLWTTKTAFTLQIQMELFKKMTNFFNTLILLNLRWIHQQEIFIACQEETSDKLTSKIICLTVILIVFKTLKTNSEWIMSFICLLRITFCISIMKMEKSKDLI